MEHIGCSELLKSIGDYLDGDIAPEICAELEEHIKSCEKCKVVVDTMKKTIYLYHEHSEINCIPGDVKEKLFQKLELKDYLKEDDKNV
jgi:predicted anti-sigma-YlaC factor YlaD